MKVKTIEPLNIDENSDEAGTLLIVNGRITINTSPAFRDRLLAILERRESLPTLTIDLTSVPYIDGSGLATLLEALKFARASKTTLRLKLHERSRYLLEVTGLLPLFEKSQGTTPVTISETN